MQRESGLGGFRDMDSRRLGGPSSAAAGYVGGAGTAGVGSGPTRSRECGKGPPKGMLGGGCPKLLVPQERPGTSNHSSGRTVFCIKLN